MEDKKDMRLYYKCLCDVYGCECEHYKVDFFLDKLASMKSEGVVLGEKGSVAKKSGFVKHL